MYNLKLWETSGHAAKYKENMFCFPIEGQVCNPTLMQPHSTRGCNLVRVGCSPVC